jgi:hypothetical protein
VDTDSICESHRKSRPAHGAVRHEFQTLDKELPVFNVKTLQQQVDESTSQDRLVATLSGSFGILAALIASIGL